MSARPWPLLHVWNAILHVRPHGLLVLHVDGQYRVMSIFGIFLSAIDLCELKCTIIMLHFRFDFLMT